MIFVSIKDFQSNIYLFINTLPITLTRRGEPFAKITKYTRRNMAKEVLDKKKKT